MSPIYSICSECHGEYRESRRADLADECAHTLRLSGKAADPALFLKAFLMALEQTLRGRCTNCCVTKIAEGAARFTPARDLLDLDATYDSERK